jgi:hypothetical protein
VLKLTSTGTEGVFGAELHASALLTNIFTPPFLAPGVWPFCRLDMSPSARLRERALAPNKVPVKVSYLTPMLFFPEGVTSLSNDFIEKLFF